MERKLRELLPAEEFSDVSTSRRRIMSAVRGQGNRSTERRLRAGLVSASVSGFRLNVADVMGRPDFFFQHAKLVVFVDGCFWHGCLRCGHVPKTRSAFWKAKIERNQERDRKNTEALQEAGFDVLRFWEHELAEDLDMCVSKVVRRVRLADAVLSLGESCRPAT